MLNTCKMIKYVEKLRKSIKNSGEKFSQKGREDFLYKVIQSIKSLSFIQICKDLCLNVVHFSKSLVNFFTIFNFLYLFASTYEVVGNPTFPTLFDCHF